MHTHTTQKQAGVVPNMLGGIKQIWKTEGFPGFYTGYKYVCVSVCDSRCMFMYVNILKN